MNDKDIISIYTRERNEVIAFQRNCAIVWVVAMVLLAILCTILVGAKWS